LTAFAVICGGTTGTAAVQSVAGVGTAGQVLTSNGAGALPTWQNGGGSGNVQTIANLGQVVLSGGSYGTMYATTITGGTLATDNDVIVAEYTILCSSVVTGTVAVSFGGNSLGNFGFTGSGPLKITVRISRFDSGDISWSYEMFDSAASGNPLQMDAGADNIAVTLASNQDIVLSFSALSGTITGAFGTVVYYPA
jgi:hypothetical protein